MCFISSWELSLVLFLAFPLIFLSYRLGHKLLYSSGSGDSHCLEVSTHLVTETVSNIKTVISLGAEDYFVESIAHYLHSHILCVDTHTQNLITENLHQPIPTYRQSMKRSVFQGLSVAFTRGMISIVFAAGWRLAAFLVIDGRIGVLQVFR